MSADSPDTPSHSDPGIQRFARRDEQVDRRDANRAVGVSALGLGLTGAVELALAVLTGSVALLGDALHNLSDVSTSVVVFAGFRISRRPPSPTYPYGYERAEDLAGLGIALVVWASAVFAGVESYRKLVGHAGTSHLGLGIAGAALGILGNQLVARYKLVVGRRIHSATLVAEARHSWLDAISSLGALVGLVLVAFGLRWGDPIAGLAVTLFICHVGYEITHQIVHHLMDGVNPDEVERARTAAATVPGVQAPVVRGRWMGRSLLLEVESEVPADLRVGQAAELGQRVKSAVLDAIPAARTVRWLSRPALSAPGGIAAEGLVAGSQRSNRG